MYSVFMVLEASQNGSVSGGKASASSAWRRLGPGRESKASGSDPASWPVPRRSKHVSEASASLRAIAFVPPPSATLIPAGPISKGGPPRSRHTTGSPAARASTITAPASSCTHGNKNTSASAILADNSSWGATLSRRPGPRRRASERDDACRPSSPPAPQITRRQSGR